MTIQGLLYIALMFALVLGAAFPLGRYMAAIFEGRVTWLRPLELGFYRLAGVDETRPMGWQGYAVALLLLSVIHFLLLYAILRLQYYLPLNPQHIAGMSPRLAFNTAASFTTNTNWQAYAPEVADLQRRADVRPCRAYVHLRRRRHCRRRRGHARLHRQRAENHRQFLCRSHAHHALPAAAGLHRCRRAAGYRRLAADLPQAAFATAHTLQGGSQTIAMGPVAFQEAIKELGTNGGGFFNANSAHPFENPNAWTNLLENWLLLVIGFALPIAFGHMVKDKAQGRALMAAMAIILALGCVGAYAAEAAGNPLHIAAGVAQQRRQLGRQGDPLRHSRLRHLQRLRHRHLHRRRGQLHRQLHAARRRHPDLPDAAWRSNPWRRRLGLLHHHRLRLLSVFVAGLMVGRTPEYLGKKVQAKEIKLAMLGVLILTLFILAGAGFSLMTASGLGSLANAGPHGLSEMLYAWTLGHRE